MQLTKTEEKLIDAMAGMDIIDWPPDNIEELAKKFEDHF